MSLQSLSFIFKKLLRLQPYKFAVTERTICTVSINQRNFRCLLKHVANEWSDVQTRNLHHCVCHELRNGLVDKVLS